MPTFRCMKQAGFARILCQSCDDKQNSYWGSANLVFASGSRRVYSLILTDNYNRRFAMHKFTLLFIVFVFALFPSFAFSVDVGDPAPDFNLISTQGQLQLSDYKGKKNVVLALYFAAFTPV